MRCACSCRAWSASWCFTRDARSPTASRRRWLAIRRWSKPIWGPQREHLPVSALIVRGLRAGYGSIAVLHGIDLEAAPGRLTVIVGPNGAGKTTLLRAISGLIPRQGEVLLDGMPLPESPAAVVRRGVGHVPEGRQLFAQMTVLETLELGAWLVPRGERSARLDEVLSAFPKLAERRSQL